METKHISFSRGTNAGKALYLGDATGGTRILGGKCWGMIKNEAKWDLDKEQALEMIQIIQEEFKIPSKKTKELTQANYLLKRVLKNFERFEDDEMITSLTEDIKGFLK